MDQLPCILVLGTIHFHRPNNGDLLRTQEVSVLDDNKVNEFIDTLAKFNPTKIFLEVDTEKQNELEAEFLNYRLGSFELKQDEIYQIGFRLGKKLNLDTVYGVDWNKIVEGTPNLGELEQEASEEFLRIIDTEKQRMKMIEEDFPKKNFSDFYTMINDSAHTLAMHQTYLNLACLGDAGIKWVSQYWYLRNLMIFKNCLSLISSPDDRIVLIYGLAHVHIIKQFIKDSNQVQLVELGNF